MSETDEEFLSRLQPSWPGTNDSVRLPMSDFNRLFALARRGADAAAEIERLGRDYDTARDAHDRRVRELDAHCVEVARLRAEVERLRAALRQIAGMDPWSDGEQGYVDKARAALKEDGDE